MPAFQAPVSSWETFLNAQRWYGSKGASVGSVEPLAFRPTDGLPLWALLRVELRDSDRGRTDPSSAVVQVCSLTARGGGEIEEDFEAPAFWEFLAGAAGGAANLEGGRLELSLDDGFKDRLGTRIACPAVLPGEMSNTLVRAGSGVLLKIYRRVEAGTHPETEALRMLQGPGFEHAPRFGGVGRFVADGAEPPVPWIVLACLEDIGECENVWEIFTRNRADPGALEKLARELGAVTARLHSALESAGGIDRTPGAASSCGELEALEVLDRVRSDLSEEARELADAVLGERPAIEERLRRATASELPRIRLHGDYHLGQIVRRKRDGRVMIVDFEGEPALPLARRRVFAPVFRDLADMMRSFAYARSVAERSRAWERSVRGGFLQAYRAESGCSVLGPAIDATFDETLLVFELRKALREVLYELGHRPDWITIPLRGIVENISCETD